MTHMDKLCSISKKECNTCYSYIRLNIQLHDEIRNTCTRISRRRLTDLFDKQRSIYPALIQDGSRQIVPEPDKVIIPSEVYKSLVLLTLWLVSQHEAFDVPEMKQSNITAVLVNKNCMPS